MMDESQMTARKREVNRLEKKNRRKGHVQHSIDLDAIV